MDKSSERVAANPWIGRPFDSERFTGNAEAILTSELGDWDSFPIVDHPPDRSGHIER